MLIRSHNQQFSFIIIFPHKAHKTKKLAHHNILNLNKLHILKFLNLKALLSYHMLNFLPYFSSINTLYTWCHQSSKKWHKYVSPINSTFRYPFSYFLNKCVSIKNLFKLFLINSKTVFSHNIQSMITLISLNRSRKLMLTILLIWVVWGLILMI